jgi:hypothetical protein
VQQPANDVLNLNDLTYFDFLLDMKVTDAENVNVTHTPPRLS